MIKEGTRAAIVLAFSPGNHLAVRREGGRSAPAFLGADLAAATAELERVFPRHTAPEEYFVTDGPGGPRRVFFTQAADAPRDPAVEFRPIGELQGRVAGLDPHLARLLTELEPHLVDIPYLHLAENDFIYKFRPEKERNASIYGQDSAASALYQSRLCSAIKALARRHERSA